MREDPLKKFRTWIFIKNNISNNNMIVMIVFSSTRFKPRAHPQTVNTVQPEGGFRRWKEPGLKLVGKLDLRYTGRAVGLRRRGSTNRPPGSYKRPIWCFQRPYAQRSPRQWPSKMAHSCAKPRRRWKRLSTPGLETVWVSSCLCSLRRLRCRWWCGMDSLMVDMVIY